MQIKKNFLAGLAILLPLVVTVAVVIFLVRLLTEPFMGVVYNFLIELNLVRRGFLGVAPEHWIRFVSQCLILVLLVGVTLGLGAIARFLFVRAFFRLGDKVISRIPLVSTVYKTTRDIIQTLFVSNKDSFKQVVLVPFPRPDVYVLGLIARESPASCSDAIHEDLVSVLVPTTPNPTTGFLMMFKRKDLIPVDMKPEDAIKYIVSCGVIIPENQTLIAPKKP